MGILTSKKYENIPANMILTYGIFTKKIIVRDSESMTRMGMGLAIASMNCSIKVRKCLFILLLYFINLCITNLGEEVLHDHFDNVKKKVCAI